MATWQVSGPTVQEYDAPNVVMRDYLCCAVRGAGGRGGEVGGMVGWWGGGMVGWWGGGVVGVGRGEYGLGSKTATWVYHLVRIGGKLDFPLLTRVQD